MRIERNISTGLLLLSVMAGCTVLVPPPAPPVERPKIEAPQPEVPPSPAPAPAPATPAPRATISDAEALLQYAAMLRRLNGTELNREHEAMKQTVAKAKTDLNRAQLALFYATPGFAFRDDARALALLEPLGKDAASPQLRSFAVLLAGLVTDNKRLEESMQTLNGKLKEEQKQSTELQLKLEALKSIEQSLSERDGALVPPPAKK